MATTDARCDARQVLLVARADETAESLRRRLVQAGVDVEAATSPFEAVGAMVTRRVFALVVDLRALSRRHLRMLDVARREGVELFGAGPLPLGLTADDLSGMRLGSWAALAARLGGGEDSPDHADPEQLAQSQEPPTGPLAMELGGVEEAESPTTVFAPAEPPPGEVPVEERPAPRSAAAVGAPAGPPTEAGGETSDERQVDLPEATQEPGGGSEDLSTGPVENLLSPEELAALLEDRR